MAIAKKTSRGRSNRVIDWVPAHRRLMKGPKKSLPRGVRFVLLELALEAKPTRGVLDFPPEWSTVDAVHDLIGGNKKEIEKALSAFSENENPEENAIKIDRRSTSHRLLIVKFDFWVGGRTSTERVRAHRERNRSEHLETDETFHPLPDETLKRSRVEYSRVEESKVEERNTSAKPPTGSDDPAPSDSSPPDRRDVDTVWNYYAASWQRTIGKGRPPKATEGRRKQIRTRLRNYSVDDLRCAIDGLFGSTFNVEKNYTYPELIFRSDEQVEINLARATQRAPSEVPDAEETRRMMAEQPEPGAAPAIAQRRVGGGWAGDLFASPRKAQPAAVNGPEQPEAAIEVP